MKLADLAFLARRASSLAPKIELINCQNSKGGETPFGGARRFERPVRVGPFLTHKRRCAVHRCALASARFVDRAKLYQEH